MSTYIDYIRLEFLEDGESDNEISAGMEIYGISYFVPALDYAYSTEADGGFLELSVRSGITLLDGQLSLEPYILEGFDFGYATRKHDGPNNFQMGIDFSFELSKTLSIVGSVAQSLAQDDVKHDGLGDVSWVSIGMAAEF